MDERVWSVDLAQSAAEGASSALQYCMNRNRARDCFLSPVETTLLRLGRWGLNSLDKSADNRLELPLITMKPLLKRPHCVRDPVIIQCALPHNGNSPAGFEQLPLGAPVSLNVVVELGLPEFRSGGWHRSILALGVPVPKAAVDEAHRSEAPEGEVGSSGQLGMESEPEPIGVQRPAERHFGLRVLGTDARHHPRPSRLVHDVCHALSAGLALTSQCETLPDVLEAIKVPAPFLRINGSFASDAAAKQLRGIARDGGAQEWKERASDRLRNDPGSIRPRAPRDRSARG